ncbi:DNA-directed RNA polymerase subunit beta' [Frankliniella fusca]|uniref:DNA-directed RNA polymerase subunit beta n=1 Tax=Frankliniella fusca TaxID=407009 RepID=A0AAE1H8F9_9NEOP|nr:DNA-directed RNA polymerase subunit beta' [Frankliniella fusca]
MTHWQLNIRCLVRAGTGYGDLLYPLAYATRARMRLQLFSAAITTSPQLHAPVSVSTAANTRTAIAHGFMVTVFLAVESYEV